MLNAVGHLFLGKVLSLFTYGSIAGFPVSSQEVQTLPGTSEAKVALRESISSPALLNNFQQEIRRQLNASLMVLYIHMDLIASIRYLRNIFMKPMVAKMIP